MVPQTILKFCYTSRLPFHITHLRLCTNLSFLCNITKLFAMACNMNIVPDLIRMVFYLIYTHRISVNEQTVHSCGWLVHDCKDTKLFLSLSLFCIAAFKNEKEAQFLMLQHRNLIRMRHSLEESLFEIRFHQNKKLKVWVWKTMGTIPKQTSWCIPHIKNILRGMRYKQHNNKQRKPLSKRWLATTRI